MWILVPEGENRSTGINLLTDKQYIVGRKDCAIIIEKDPSISRKHATISVNHSEANLTDPAKIPELTLQDTSKYGIVVNEKKVTDLVTLNSGDKVLFGNHDSNYRVFYRPLVVITSCLDNNQKKKLKSLVQKLGGHVVNEWHLKPAITHLVMAELTFTIKVIHALAACCPVVKPSYFEELINCIDANSVNLAVEQYLPPLKEAVINSAEVSFHPVQDRQNLFCNHTFVFLSKKQYKRLLLSIQMSGGKAVVKDPNDNDFRDQDVETGEGLIEDKTHVMMVEAKERSGLSSDAKQLVSGVIDTLRRHKKRPIPESEFGLALLHCSLEKYCNSSIDAVPELTQALVSQSFHMADMMSQAASLSQQPQASHFVSPQFKRPVPIKPKQPAVEPGKKRTRGEDQSQARLGSESSSDEEMMSKRRKVSDESKQVVLESRNKNANDAGGHQVNNITETEGMDTTSGDIHTGTPVPETQCTNTSRINRSIGRPVLETQNMDSSRGDSHTGRPIPETQGHGDNHTGRPILETQSHGDSHTIRPILETQKIDSRNVEGRTGRSVPEIQGMDTSGAVATGCLVAETQEMEPLCAESLLDVSKSVVGESTQLRNSDDRDSSRNATGRDLTSPSDKKQKAKSISCLSDSKTSSRSNSKAVTACMNIKKENVSPKSKGRNEGSWLGVKVSTQDSHSKSDSCADAEDDASPLPFDVKKGESIGGKRQKSDLKPDNVGIALTVKREASEDFEVVPDGFLSSRLPRQIPAGFAQEDSWEDIPSDLVVVQNVSLVVRQPGYSKAQVAATDPNVKNFKKFKKQYYPGCEGILPRIIGGSDLVAHQSSNSADLEHWLNEAREANAEQDREERKAEALFRWDGKQHSSTRSRR